MAATNSENATSGRKNYYNFSYGKLSSKQKEIPNGFEEIKEIDLKSKIDKTEQIDLRNKYINKGTGERPYVVFNDNITGVIQSFEQVKGDKGINLVLSIIDNDGDLSHLQCKYYSKYTENLLNRLILTSPNDSVYFFPYAIPADMKDENGKELKFYNQGVSVQVNSKKILPKYNKDNNYTVGGAELPKTERVENAEGETVTSRVKRVNFLWNEFSNKFSNIQLITPTPQTLKLVENSFKGKIEMTSHIPDSEEFDKLPF